MSEMEERKKPTVISSSWVTDPAGLKKLQDAQVKKVKEYTKTRDEGDLVKICAEEGQVAYDQCKRGSV